MFFALDNIHSQESAGVNKEISGAYLLILHWRMGLAQILKNCHRDQDGVT